MTISSFKVDSVLKAYSKQNTSKNPPLENVDAEDKYRDTVTLSPSDYNSKAYEKITYGLLDIILQNKPY